MSFDLMMELFESFYDWFPVPMPDIRDQMFKLTLYLKINYDIDISIYHDGTNSDMFTDDNDMKEKIVEFPELNDLFNYDEQDEPAFSLGREPGFPGPSNPIEVYDLLWHQHNDPLHRIGAHPEVSKCLPSDLSNLCLQYDTA